MKKSGFLSKLKEGLLTNNPVLIQLLGMCPTLGITTTLSNSLGMGLAATAVLCCSNLFISLLRRFIPKEVRIAAYIVIISGFVSCIELLLHAYLPSLYETLGIFIPLIVVNCIILARAEAFASKNKPLPSLVDGLCMGLGFTFALLLMGFVRELLGTGRLFGFDLFFGHYTEIGFFTCAAGGFMVLGALIAAVTFLRNRAAERRGKAVAEEAENKEEEQRHE